MKIGHIIKKIRISRGMRQADLADAIGTDNGNISRIESGGQNVSLVTLQKIATALNVNQSLIFRLAEGEEVDMSRNHTNTAVKSDSKPIRLVPRITWADAALGLWENLEMVRETTPAPVNAGTRSFSLAIKDDSMASAIAGMPSYPVGVEIVVDPDLSPANGRRVVAKTRLSDEAIFRIYRLDAGKKWLSPINPQYEKIEIDKNVAIIGVVIGTWVPE